MYSEEHAQSAGARTTLSCGAYELNRYTSLASILYEAYCIPNREILRLWRIILFRLKRLVPPLHHATFAYTLLSSHFDTCERSFARCAHGAFSRADAAPETPLYSLATLLDD